MNNIFTKNNYRIIRSIFFFILFFVISPSVIFSQSNERKPPDPTAHHEVKDDDYSRVLRHTQDRSPAYNYTMNNIITTQVNVDENGQNIVGDAANEPSIAVDLNNPNRIAIGWRQFNTVSNNFRQAGWGFTTDGGMSWTFPGVIEPGVFRSDPVLGADADGNFYYNSLTTNPYTCDVYKSIDGGSSWDDGTYAHGGDKQWMTIDNSGGIGDGNIYAYWTYAFSVCDPGFFTRSADDGESFEDCITIPNQPYWGTLAVNADGELYVGGTIGFNFQVAKSSNAQIPGETIVWDMTTTVNLDGTIANGYGPNPGGLLGQTSVAVDTSGGPYNGNVYLLCSVERNSTSDPLDVMFARSTDGGVNWSSPIKINDDANNSAYQWFGTMAVAPNGRIDVIWLDTRDNPGTYLSALYYSYSMDGGITWSENVRLSDFFDPHVGWPNQNKMGDYFDLVSDNEGAYLAWAATFNNEQDVYFSYITEGNVPVELQSFSASVSSNVVTLNWSTATELNNYGFEIERCTDQTNWETVGFKEGNGTTSEKHNYTFIDNLTGKESYKLFYRLKQLDFNGSFEYSNAVEVNIAPSDFELSQNYPNPFNPVTNISYQLPVKSLVTLKVYDILGKEVAALVNEEKEAGKYDVKFDAAYLPSGMYLIKISAGNYQKTVKAILMK